MIIGFYDDPDELDEAFWESMQELTWKIELFQFNDFLVESRGLEGYVLECFWDLRLVIQKNCGIIS